MKTFINRFVAILLSVLLIGSSSVYAQNWSSYQWQPQNTSSQKTNQPKTGILVEDPLADLINQAKGIREALLSDDEKEQPLISQNEFKNIYKEEAEKAYQQAKKQAKNDPQKLKQINERYHALTSAQEITNQWNKSYKNRFADLPESDDMTETEKELRNFGKLVMDAYDEHKTQNLLDIIEQDFPLYASIGALDTKVRNRARTVLRGIVSGNVSACGNKGFSSGKCNKAIQAAAALAILGDFNDSKRTDLIPLENLLTKAYEGPLAYSAVFLAAAALLTAGQTGAIKSLLVGAANQAKEKQEDLLGGPLFMPSTWINAAQNDGGDSYYLTGYENTFYDISSLDEGSGCVLTDLGEYFAEEAAKGNRNAKEILNSVAGLTIQATPFRANRLMDVQMTPFWAGAIGGGYVISNMGYRGTALDGNGRSFNVDTVQYWNDAAAKIRQQGTDYTGYIAYQLYKNKKASVNAWAALYANNHLAGIVQARNPNKQVAIYEQPTSKQISKVKTQQIFLNVVGPVSDFVMEWVIMDVALTGGLSTVKGIGKAVKNAPQAIRAIRFRNLQRVVKAARAGLTTKLTTFAAKAKTPKEIKKIQKLRKVVLRSQRRQAARLELYTRFSTSFGIQTRIPAPALTGSQAVVKGSRAGKEVIGTSRSVNSGKSVVQLPENAHVNTQLGLQKVEAPKSFSAPAKVKAPAQNRGLARRTPAAPKSTPTTLKVEVPATAPTPKADAVSATKIESKLTGSLDSKVAAASAKQPYIAPTATNTQFSLSDEIMSGASDLEFTSSAKSGSWWSKLLGKKEPTSVKPPTGSRLDEQTKQLALQKMKQAREAKEATHAAKQASRAEESFANAAQNIPSAAPFSTSAATNTTQVAQRVSELGSQVKNGWKGTFSEISENLTRARRTSLIPAQRARVEEAERYFSKLTPEQANDWGTLTSREFQKHAAVLRSPTATEQAFYVEGAGFEDTFFRSAPNMQKTKGYIPSVVGEPTKGFVRADLQEAFKLAEQTDQPILVQLTSHGEIDAAGFYIPSRGLSNSAKVRTADLVDDLQMLRRTTGTPEINLQLDACHSGKFMQEFEALPQAKRNGINVYAHAGGVKQENLVGPVSAMARSRGTGSIASSQTQILIKQIEGRNVFARGYINGTSFNPLQQAALRAKAEANPLANELNLLYRLQNANGTEVNTIMSKYKTLSTRVGFSRGNNFTATSVTPSGDALRFISDTAQKMLAGQRW